jgi:hypothetical protein
LKLADSSAYYLFRKRSLAMFKFYFVHNEGEEML